MKTLFLCSQFFQGSVALLLLFTVLFELSLTSCSWINQVILFTIQVSALYLSNFLLFIVHLIFVKWQRIVCHIYLTIYRSFQFFILCLHVQDLGFKVYFFRTETYKVNHNNLHRKTVYNDKVKVICTYWKDCINLSLRGALNQTALAMRN